MYEPSTSGITRLWVFQMMACTLPVGFALWFLVNFGVGFGSWMCTSLLVLVARMNWQSRGRPWFWAGILVSAIAQIPFIVYIPWTAPHGRSPYVYGFGFLDYFLIYGCMKLAGKIAGDQGREDRET
jgi:hypothetical protein